MISDDIEVITIEGTAQSITIDPDILEELEFYALFDEIEYSQYREASESNVI